jgi:hypothetical protein
LLKMAWFKGRSWFGIGSTRNWTEKSQGSTPSLSSARVEGRAQLQA